jgi:hypothetical protein
MTREPWNLLARDWLQPASSFSLLRPSINGPIRLHLHAFGERRRSLTSYNRARPTALAPEQSCLTYSSPGQSVQLERAYRFVYTVSVYLSVPCCDS